MTPEGATPLGRGAEFDLIRTLLERWGPLAVGIGDDAAVLDVPRGDRLVVSTDASLEGVHFRREWMPPYCISCRAVTAALSDLAAMAAQPLGVVVAFEIPPAYGEWILPLADGVAMAVKRAGTVIRGGNIAGGAKLGITTTVLGSAHTPLTRSGARPGDLIYVTGTLGGPRAALRYRQAEKLPTEWMLDRFNAPTARLREARWLARRGATAAIDISDGLAGDAMHLAAASGVALDIRVDDVPTLEHLEPDDVFGGEEYELLVTSRVPLSVVDFTREFGIALTLIGRVAEGPVDARFTRAGKRVAPPVGYEHLSR